MPFICTIFICTVSFFRWFVNKSLEWVLASMRSFYFNRRLEYILSSYRFVESLIKRCRIEALLNFIKLNRCAWAVQVYTIFIHNIACICVYAVCVWFVFLNHLRKNGNRHTKKGPQTCLVYILFSYVMLHRSIAIFTVKITCSMPCAMNCSPTNLCLGVCSLIYLSYIMSTT